MTEKISLYEKLKKYCETDAYPYHMPGHKRRRLGNLPEQILAADITEIDGFDSLHDADGILLEAQKRASALYHADESFYLINGSTCGILSAVSAALPEGGKLLIARGCHKSVYHAAYLRHLQLRYLYPPSVKDFDFCEAVTAEEVERALEQEPDTGAVLIVSPTYEGRIANVRAVAEVVHKKGIPLIVDEAHGAHLGFAENFAPGSCTEGADLVIHSVHKTLPAMTQTALLHVNGDFVDRDRVRRFLHIYQSSSPSYVLMSGICDALEIVEDQGKKLFADFYRLYHWMMEELERCCSLRFVPWADVEAGKQDVGKLVIDTMHAGVSGRWLYDTLRERYHLQCEMAAGQYCLAMFTLADGEEAYRRMVQALIELDCELTMNRKEDTPKPREPRQDSVLIRYSLSEAWEKPCKTVSLRNAVDAAVGVFVNLYPPGTPILVPGEVLSREIYEQLLEYQGQNLNLQGIKRINGESYIKVIES